MKTCIVKINFLENKICVHSEVDITNVFGETVRGFESSLFKNSENLICSRSEMDITFVFGTKVSGSNPDGSTTLNPFILGTCSDFDNRYIFYLSRTPTRTP